MIRKIGQRLRAWWLLKLVFFHQMPEEQALLSEFFYFNLYYVTCVKTAEAIKEAGMTVQMELDW